MSIDQPQANPETTDDHEVDYDWVLQSALDILEEPEHEETLRHNLELMTPQEVAQILESLPVAQREAVYALLAIDKLWPVAKELYEDSAKHLLRTVSDDARLHIQGMVTAEDIRAYGDWLPQRMVDAVMLDQDEATLKALQEALSYEDTQVGRYLDKSIMRVRPKISVGSLSSRLRKRGRVHGIYVVDEEGALLGHVSTESQLSSDDDRPVSDIMQPIVAFEHSDQFKDILKTIHSDDQVAWYPVEKDGALVGCFPVSAILWEMQDSILSTAVTEAPSTEEDLFTPIPKAARLRAFWLVINLATAFMASAVIGMFEGTLQQVVALAILMPVVASMGGIAGSQTLAVALRGLALNHISSANLDLLLKKESKIAAINGAAIGVLIAAVVAWWFDSFLLGAIILVAIVINSLAAASSGTLIPFILNKFNIDPAISGAVILTTVTDIVGFVVFLGLGALLLAS